MWLVAAALSYWVLSGMSSTTERRPALLGPMAAVEGPTLARCPASQPADEGVADGPRAGSIGDALGLDSAGDLAAQLQGQPLATEPGGVGPYPGPGSRRVAGMRRVADGGADELAVWLISGASVERVAEHYTEAATRVGFKAGPMRTSSAGGRLPTTAPASTSQTFFRSNNHVGPGLEVLTVTVSPTGIGTQVRATLLLRYAIGQSNAGR